MGQPIRESLRDLSGFHGSLFGTQDILKYSLEGHGVAANASGGKKEALTLPTARIKGNFVDVVLAVEGGLEAGKADPLRFLGVFFGLVYFADDARIHLPLLTPNYFLILKSAAGRVKEILWRLISYTKPNLAGITLFLSIITSLS